MAKIARSVMGIPALVGVGFAAAGSLVWLLLEQWSIHLGAGSAQYVLDGTFVLLLSMQTGYFIAALPLLRRAGQRCIGELQPLLDMSDPGLLALIKRFDDIRLRAFGIAAVVGACATGIFQEAQFGRFSNWWAQPDAALGEFWTVLTAWATWTLGLSAASIVVADAAAMRRLGRDWVAVDLLRIGQLTCFSRYGMQLAGTVIGLMALWAASLVLIAPFVGTRLTEDNSNIGLVTVIIYMSLAITVFVFPQLGIRERVVVEKARICDELTRALPSSCEVVEQAELNPGRLSGLLNTRAQIQNIPEWPAGQLIQIRLLFYLVVPLLSWSAAALVEELISRILAG